MFLSKKSCLFLRSVSNQIYDRCVFQHRVLYEESDEVHCVHDELLIVAGVHLRSFDLIRGIYEVSINDRMTVLKMLLIELHNSFGDRTVLDYSRWTILKETVIRQLAHDLSNLRNAAMLSVQYGRRETRTLETVLERQLNLSSKHIIVLVGLDNRLQLLLIPDEDSCAGMTKVKGTAS